jgi:pyrroloquinoline quinone (PQQ) biosynthesis protein C
MPFFDELVERTAPERAGLMSIPAIAQCLAGRVTRAQYVAFLREAYHHVKHTVPLLMACGSRLDGGQRALRAAVSQYIAEESGHEDWILDDLRACGEDAEAVRAGAPAPATELMVAYVYDYIGRINPAGMFGMVHVLEGTSSAIATRAAASIERTLALPPEALTYLTSHGALDQEHVQFFKRTVESLSKPDREAVVHVSRMVYRLYGDIFRSLPS